MMGPTIVFTIPVGLPPHGMTEANDAYTQLLLLNEPIIKFFSKNIVFFTRYIIQSFT